MLRTIGWLGRDLISVAFALSMAFLWIRLVVPLLVRPFGITIRVSLTSRHEWEEDIRGLPPLSNVLVFGVLMVGLGMILARLATSFVDWKFFGDPWRFISLRDLVYGTILWAVASVLIVLFKTKVQAPDRN